jgi:hypothetical protein
MRILTLLLNVGLTLFVLSGALLGQTDSLGFPDTLAIEVTRVDDANWAVTFSYINDHHIAGLSIPMKMNAGLTRIVADSAVWSERVTDFGLKAFRPDTAIQCVTLGLIGSLTGQKVRLAPGNGEIVTVYVSAVEDKPLEKLNVDTTTTHPNNSLMTVADQLQGEPPDTTRLANPAMKIFPAVVFRGQEKEAATEGSQ